MIPFPVPCHVPVCIRLLGRYMVSLLGRGTSRNPMFSYFSKKREKRCIVIAWHWASIITYTSGLDRQTDSTYLLVFSTSFIPCIWHCRYYPESSSSSSSLPNSFYCPSEGGPCLIPRAVSLFYSILFSSLTSIFLYPNNHHTLYQIIIIICRS